MEGGDECNAHSTLCTLELDLSQMPEDVAMLWLLKPSGALPGTHLFSQVVSSFCRGAFGLIQKNQVAEDCPTLCRYLQQLRYRHGTASISFWNGPANHDKGGNHSPGVQGFIETHNLMGISEKKSKFPNRTDYKGGVVHVDCVAFLEACQRVNALALEAGRCKDFITSQAVDAMAIKENVAVAVAVLELVG